jgi:fatty-acyl-CoA synthase
MRSTMQETPLSIATLVRYGTTVHGSSEVVTWTGEGARSATYAEVGRRAAQLAHALRALGVTGDDRVGTFMWNNQEHLEAYLAVPAMGAVLHPLNIRLFPDQLAFIADHGGDKVVLVDGSVLPLLAKVLGQLPQVEHVVVNGPADLSVLEGTSASVHAYEDLLAGQPDEFDWVDPDDETEAAAMCYTSGTTGNPKGVAYSHRSIYLHSMQICMSDGFAMGQRDRVLLIVPMFHVLAWGTPYAAMMSGASLVMPDRFLTPEPLADLIETARPTLAGGVPTVWTALLAYLDQTPRDMSSLRDVIVGGSACPRSLMEGLERHGVHVTHAWGMTETSPLGSISREPGGVEGEDAWRYRVTQGRLAASVQARLVGPDGSVVPRDGTAVGELEVRGPWITGSYVRDDDPAKFDDGWLRTGDVGSITPDGFLTLTDRSKDVIKSGGEWISSVALENALMAHPSVAEASVVGVPDEKWGERPLATVVVREGVEVSADELRAFLAERVAHWQLPERWSFVDEVPKTSVGKFDKKVIRRRYADGALDVQTLTPPTSE